MTTTTDAALVLVAAGASERMGKLGKKEYLPLGGGSVLSTAAEAFLRTNLFDTIIVSYQKNSLKEARAALYASEEARRLLRGTTVIFAEGGKSRQESVRLALEALKRRFKKARAANRIVMIHDGARPFLTSALVLRTFKATQKYGAAVPGLEPVETQKEITSAKKISRHLQRKNLASIQTPQGFVFDKILEYHRRALKESRVATDDTEIWDAYSDKKTRVVKGESGNIKITFPKDIASSGASEQSWASPPRRAPTPPKPQCEKEFRVGLGSDLHRLVEGRPLLVGGVLLPFDKGEEAHSDGDALLHAITDALLGAAALGDIGSYFPDTDKKWKDANSKKLLAAAWRDVKKRGWSLENLDCVVKLEKPKFLPHREAARKSIAEILGVQKERVFVKAKTGEGLGSVGRGEAIEAEVVCLLVRQVQN